MRGFKEGLEGLFTRGRGRLARDSARIVWYSTQIYRVELHLHTRARAYVQQGICVIFVLAVTSRAFPRGV
jgi:hypothetical protein